MTFSEIIPRSDQAVVENAVIEICFTLRMLSFFVPFIPEFLEQRTEALPAAVDKQRQSM